MTLVIDFPKRGTIWQGTKFRNERLAVSSSSKSDLLFVYGTLRKEARHEMYHVLATHSTYLGEGRIHGELFDLGPYPAVWLREGCVDVVLGEVYELNSQGAGWTWRVLDSYEKCGPGDAMPHEYRRQRVHVFLSDGKELEVWAYVLNRLPVTATRIPSGDYLAWLRKERRQSKYV
jgi:gamma-glutamylcyclotransferase (GGCT)/AIG2-like uncharacterized protein YtfP